MAVVVRPKDDAESEPILRAAFLLFDVDYARDFSFGSENTESEGKSGRQREDEQKANSIRA